MAANLSEGFGRFHYKENKQYGYYSRGSLLETKTWLSKAHNRSLVSEEAFEELGTTLDTMGHRLNTYIKSIGNQGYTVKESPPRMGHE
jgi:four helix bundle protein